MKLAGNGEDFFTLLVMTRDPHAFLTHFKDESQPGDCLLLYRPSFGRNSACYGEFDAIFVSTCRTYLIESKWLRGPAAKIGVVMKENQLLRHKILSWYISNWSIDYLGKWNEFRKNKSDEFSRTFGGKSIPGDRSQLSKNIEYVLKTIQDHNGLKTDVINVLIGFSTTDGNIATPAVPVGFVLYPSKVATINATSYVLTEITLG